MSFSTIYADSFRAYENKENISAAIQNKVDNVADNEVLFGSVDYSSAYDKVSQNMQEQLDAIEQNSQANGADGTNGTGATSSEEAATAGDAIFGKAECTDGKDDGKIGFFEGVGSFFKGIGKAVVNTVTSIVTDPKKLLLTAGAVALSIVFPPAGVAMAVAGGIAGAVQVGKGIYNAATAKTDAEAKEALESMGSGTLQVGLSVVGAKAGLKAMSNTSGSAMSALKAGGTKPTFGQTVKAFAKDTVTGGRGASWAGKGSIKTAWTNTSSNAGGYMLTKGVSKLSGNIASDGVVKGTWQTTKELGNAAKTSYKTAKAERMANKEVAKYQKEVSKYQKEIDNLTKKLQDSKLSETAREQLEDQLRIAKNNKVVAEAKFANSSTSKMAEVTEQYNKAKSKYDIAEKVEKKIKSQGKELTEVQQTRIQKVKAEYSAAKKALEEQQAAFKAREIALQKYDTSQTRISNAESALEQARSNYKNLSKNATEAEIKAASDAVAKARMELAKAKYDAPKTSSVSQATQAISKKASQAGYEGSGYRPFLKATLGPMAYELESA